MVARTRYKVANVDRYSGTSRPVTVAVVGDSRLEASALRHQLLHVYRRKPDALIRVGEGCVWFEGAALVFAPPHPSPLFV